MNLIVENCGPLLSPDPERPYRIEALEGDTLVIREGRIEAVIQGEAGGPALKAARAEDFERLDAGGAMLLPGFVDSHTHPVFFEHRAGEYELRNAGRSYLEIQQAGGGILSSRRSLMEADPTELRERVRRRLRRFLKLGTTSIEAKSGYGLSVEHELLSLRILKELAADEALGLHATLLAAHSVPPEYGERRAEWFAEIEESILPAVAREGLAEFIDAFCEPSVITLQESERILRAGLMRGLRVKLHADQIEAYGGARLAARLGALSADHLERVDGEGIRNMVRAGTVFALLPGATFFLGLRDYAPARRIIEAGGLVALCTDYNPGSSHIQSMPLILTLATSQMKLSAEEAVWAATQGGARAIGRGGELGSLRPGYWADLALWPFRELAELPYTAGDNRPLQVIKAGRPVV